MSSVCRPMLLALLALSTESRFAQYSPHTHESHLLKLSRSDGASPAWVHSTCQPRMLDGNRHGASADFWRQRVRLASQKVGPVGDSDAESSSTWKWLQEKTQGRTTQFDILLKRSSNRIEVERQKLELKSRQNEIVKLQRTLVNSSDVVTSYRQLVADIEVKLAAAGAQDVSADSEEAVRVAVLRAQLAEAQHNLATFQSSVGKAQAQTEQLVRELKRSESQLEELRIRNELEAERDRQALRLKGMLEAITEGTDSYKSLHLLSPLLEQLPLSHKPAPEAPAQHLPHPVPAEEARGAGAGEREAVRAFLKKQLGKAGAVLEEGLCERGWAGREEGVREAFRVLREEAGLSNDRIAAVAQAHPALLEGEAGPQLRRVVEFLVEEVGVEREAVGGVVAAQPGVLGRSVEEELRAVVGVVREEAHVGQGKVGKVIQQTPRLLVLRPEEGPRQVARFLRREVGLSAEGVGKVVVAFPQLLTMPESSLRQTYEWLRSIGVPKGKLERVVRLHPKTMGYSLSNNLQPTVRYLWEEVGVPPERLGRMIASFPQLLGLSVQGNLRPMVRFLLDEVGVDPARLNKMFCSFPQLFGLSLENNIRPHVEYLVCEVGIPREKLGKAVVTFPHLLAYNLEDKLRPTVDFLQTLGIPRARMGKLVATHPQILGYSVEDKLVPTVRYLVDDVGVSSERIGEVVERCPKLLGCSIDKNLRPTVQFLVEEVGIHRTQIGQVVTKYPQLLGLSIENNLRPKLAYLTQEVNVEHDEIRKLLVTGPQLLAYSLENRIKPRHRLLLGKGLKLGLHSMLSPSDLSFYERYGDGLSRVPSVKASLNVVDSASTGYYWDGDPTEESGARLDSIRRSRPRAPAAQRARAAKRPGPGRKGTATQTRARRLKEPPKQSPQPPQADQSGGIMSSPA